MTRPTPYPVLLVSGTRTGGTFLAHCLDSHPHVYCTREEILHHTSSIKKLKGLTAIEYARPYLTHRGYRVCIVRFTYSQADVANKVFRFVASHKGGRFIHLIRRNTLRTIVSQILQIAGKRDKIGYPTHTLGTVEFDSIYIDPDKLLKRMHDRVDGQERYADKLAHYGKPVLTVTYENMVGREDKNASEMVEGASRKLCKFLCVDNLPLTSVLRKGNRFPLRKVIENWDEIEGVVTNSEFAYCLEDEKLFN